MSRTARRGGFTLVELLVVIGIIALLISILMPALNRAREQARSIQCLSNLKQLGTAMVMYTGQYGRYPRPSVQALPEDWLHWQFQTAPSVHDFRKGGIAEFLGGNAIPAFFRCPSDDLATHVVRNGAGEAYYPYSYSVNFNICVYTGHPTIQPANTLKPSQVQLSSQKILMIDESSETADDGCWAWQWFGGSGMNVLSNRHDKRKETANDPNAGYGNALFCDGHAERIERVKTYNQRYYDPFYPAGGRWTLPPPTIPQPD